MDHSSEVNQGEVGMPSAEDIFKMSKIERKQFLQKEAAKLDSPESLDNDLVDAYKFSSVINSFILDYFQLCVSNDLSQPEGSILNDQNLIKSIKKVTAEYHAKGSATLTNSLTSVEAIQNSAKNIYEISGALRLASGNNITRTLSTIMGAMWEELANISPYAVNPESEFNIAIKGVDLILFNKDRNLVEYAQLKTQKNTLTGSQKHRSVKELELHDNPLFCAAFSSNSRWTFNHDTIPRIEGREFWERIGMRYDLVLNAVKALVLELEKEYVGETS